MFTVTAVNVCNYGNISNENLRCTVEPDWPVDACIVEKVEIRRLYEISNRISEIKHTVQFYKIDIAAFRVITHEHHFCTEIPHEELFDGSTCY